jgi:hypothetical protein
MTRFLKLIQYLCSNCKKKISINLDSEIRNLSILPHVLSHLPMIMAARNAWRGRKLALFSIAHHILPKLVNGCNNQNLKEKKKLLFCVD